MKKLFLVCSVVLLLMGLGSAQAVDSTATLKWEAPTTNDDADNTCLTDLSFYKVYYGNATTPTDFWTTALTDPNLSCVDSGIDAGTGCGNYETCTFVTPTLADGLWYFNVTANDFSNNESIRSNEVSKGIDNVPASGCNNLEEISGP
jgi:hypothetical protein